MSPLFASLNYGTQASFVCMKKRGKVQIFFCAGSHRYDSTKCGRISGVERANIFHMGSKYMMMITTIISIMVFPQVGPKAHSFAGVA